MFTNRIAYTVGTNPYSLILDDFNNDTKLDIVSVNKGDSSISILFGDGNGIFHNQIN